MGVTREEDPAELFIPAALEMPANRVHSLPDPFPIRVARIDPLHEPHAFDGMARKKGLASVARRQSSSWEDEFVQQMVLRLEMLRHDSLSQLQGPSENLRVVGREAEFVINERKDHGWTMRLQTRRNRVRTRGKA